MVKPGSSMGMPSKIKLEEPESSSSSEDVEEMEQALADVTFGELQKVRSNGSHVVHLKPKEEKKGGRWRLLARSLSLDFERSFKVQKRFRKKYRFLFEEELPAKKDELQKQIKKSKDPETIEELKKHIFLIDKQLNSESAKCTEAAILSEHKKKERKAAKEGKQPFFLKKCNALSCCLSTSVRMFICLRFKILLVSTYEMQGNENFLFEIFYHNSKEQL
ncbi:rRNA biogenesis protein rrp36-like [Pyrus communis]|uniref:rRNA biogenesis protein rrp36-like n=1 Tax=Pyrus communis TaxID=23211 RepID=UPI0035C0E4CB